MTAFVPTADKLLPDLAPQEELTILARTLWREGYDDHLAGHITINRGDGTLWCNPWLMTWAEFRPADVIVIDLEGNVLEGNWPMPPGATIHLELHKARPGIGVVVHSHPRFGTVWADMQRIPDMFDQSSGLGGGKVALVDEYRGAVNDRGAARAAVEAFGDADLGLLANHGVLIVGANVRAAHQRAVAFEQRCRNAWYVAAAGGGVPLPEEVQDRFTASDGTKFHGFWEVMARQELAADPTLLERC
jgi:ribulose-5-phosphate 4-epimerase/fuculose-1-phosphate aldolase